jgi:hypothetical protein
MTQIARTALRRPDNVPPARDAPLWIRSRRCSMSFRLSEVLQEVRYNRTKIKQIKTTMPIQKMISAADGSLAEGANLSSNRTASLLINVSNKPVNSRARVSTAGSANEPHYTCRSEVL